MKGLDRGPILVTGASGGIGAATVRQLAAANAQVIASGRNVDQLKSLADDTGCRILPFDLEFAGERPRCIGRARRLWRGELRRLRRRDRDAHGYRYRRLRQGDLDQRPWCATCHQIHVGLDDPSRQGGRDRQRLEFRRPLLRFRVTSPTGHRRRPSTTSPASRR